MNIISPQVRKLREEQGLTQDELAARCNLEGWNISRGTLAKIESQVRRVTDEELLPISRAIGVEVSSLFDKN